jgi:hypothetical protein
MEIDRPSTRTPTPEEQRALDQFREKVHQLALHGGLTAENVRRVVAAMRAHPDFSAEIMQVLFDEASQLREAAPGTSLLDLE